MKRKQFVSATLLALTAVALLAFGNYPSAPKLPGGPPGLPSDLDGYLDTTESKERDEYGLIAGTEKRIRWHGRPATKTPLSIIYLHGFSATRQEIAPVAEMVADSLGANLFEARLTAHGRERSALSGASAEDWLGDAVEAIAIGAAIGHRVAIVSTSTGGTLALAMLKHAMMRPVDALILMSPNLVLRDTSSEIMVWPGGPLIARLVIGESRSWEAKNELQEKYWTTTYPTATVVEVVRLMKFARDSMPARIDQHLLTITSTEDSVVDPEASWQWIASIDAPRNQQVDFPYSTDPGQHVLAGDILSPGSNQALADTITTFLSALPATPAAR